MWSDKSSFKETEILKEEEELARRQKWKQETNQTSKLIFKMGWWNKKTWSTLLNNRLITAFYSPGYSSHSVSTVKWRGFTPEHFEQHLTQMLPFNSLEKPFFTDYRQSLRKLWKHLMTAIKINSWKKYNLSSEMEVVRQRRNKNLLHSDKWSYSLTVIE